jgi:septin family protein
MRPVVGSEPLPARSRKSSVHDLRGSGPGSSSAAAANADSQMTFFLADESTMENSIARSQEEQSKRTVEDSNYGIQSFQMEEEDTAIEDKEGGEDTIASKITPGDLNRRESNVTNRSQSSNTTLKTTFVSARQLPHKLSNPTLSQPLTPVYPDSSAPESSLPSPLSFSLRSFKNSDSDSLLESSDGQNMLLSADGEYDSELASPDASDPQLIMPSIMMPSRRPFTDRGKAMGKIKVLIAGDSGVGKTSVIKAIVQTCEDIVHVDPPTLLGSSKASETKKSSSKKEEHDPKRTRHITEIQASTKPYPKWWTSSDGDSSRRKKRVGDEVLERNICFVDTAGYGYKTKSSEIIDKVVSYVESQLERTAAGLRMANDDVISLLTGNGGSEVDVVLYLITDRKTSILHITDTTDKFTAELKPIDIEYLRRLTPLTNVIPVIAKADTIEPTDASATKSKIIRELENIGIRTFNFGHSKDEVEAGRVRGPPFAISAATSNDIEHMDASLLMNSDYIQPLIPSDLATLVAELFSPENIAWLKHLAARKFIHWRDGTSTSPTSPSFSYQMQSLALVGPNPYNHGDSPSHATSSQALARFNDHTRREERLAQLRLAKWATDLQRSLQNERDKYEVIARGQQQAWLTEKLTECMNEKGLVPTAIGQDMVLATRTGSKKQSPSGTVNKPYLYPKIDPRDPMGLLEWTEMVRKRGWLVVQILGSFGVVGGVAIWIMNNWGSGGNDSQSEGLILRDWNWRIWETAE